MWVSGRVRLPVPEDRLGLKDGLLEKSATLRASIETHPVIRDTLSIGGNTGLQYRSALVCMQPIVFTYRGILIEFISSDEIDGEHDLDVVLLGLRDEGRNLLGASLVEKRVANLRRKWRSVSSQSTR